MESALPKMGIIPVYDPERKQTTWVNTSASSFREQLHDNAKEYAALKNQCKQWQADYVSIPAGEDFVPALVKLFNVRK
jgi:sialic acid synthase SpsE